MIKIGFTLCLGIAIALSLASITEAATQRECLDACIAANKFNFTCCDCCGETETCNGDYEHRECCESTESYCGCYTNRAYCSGGVFGQDSSQVSTFGTCFDSANGQCCYNSVELNWMVCPKDYTCCDSISGFSCCAPGTYCNTTEYDPQAVCVPVASASPSSSSSSSYSSSSYSSTSRSSSSSVNVIASSSKIPSTEGDSTSVVEDTSSMENNQSVQPSSESSLPSSGLDRGQKISAAFQLTSGILSVLLVALF